MMENNLVPWNSLEHRGEIQEIKSLLKIMLLNKGYDMPTATTATFEFLAESFIDMGGKFHDFEYLINALMGAIKEVWPKDER
jgi:hypothetical protein